MNKERTRIIRQVKLQINFEFSHNFSLTYDCVGDIK